MLLYLVGGAVLLFVGYTIYMADKDSKTEKKKTKKLDL
jgi:threonine/homoserine/homoserine lactone efflux protein